MKRKKKRQERHLINLFCFDVFGYKESTRKEKKNDKKIRINLVRIWIIYGEEHKEHEYVLLKKKRKKIGIKKFYFN